MEIDESKLFCPIVPVFLEWDGKVKRDVKNKKDVSGNSRLKTLMGIGLEVERSEKFKRKDVRRGTFKEGKLDDRQKTDKDRPTM
jgi:hypothetical protein